MAEHSFVAVGGRWLYRRQHLAPGRFVERFETVRVPDLDPGLEGLTIAQLSDLHAGAFLGAGDLSAVVEAVARRCPDMVVITGDMIAHHCLTIHRTDENTTERPRRALGIVFYELLTGLPPFGVGRPKTIFRALRDCTVRSPSELRGELKGSGFEEAFSTDSDEAAT